MPVAECRLRFGLPQTVEDFLCPRVYRRRPLLGLLEVTASNPIGGVVPLGTYPWFPN